MVFVSSSPARCIIALLALYAFRIAEASYGASSRVYLATASIPQTRPSHRQRTRIVQHRRRQQPSDPPAIWLASSTTTKRPKKKSSSSSTTLSPVEPPELTVGDLGPAAYVVAGTVEIALTTLLEYLSGFMGGYVLGSITDVPRLLFRKVSTDQPLLRDVSQRFVRMHGKSLNWARNWAGISAAFGGFRVATKVIRGQKEDEWNTVFSSAAAGAYFARKEGPQAMVRSALLYGGLVFVISGGKLGGKKPSDFPLEEPVDF